MDNRSNNQSPEEIAQAEHQKTQELSNAYTRLFSTPDGQTVMGDMNSRYLVNIIKPNDDHSFWSGCKSVMVYIINRQQAGANNAHQRES